jgi:hypothetical protein
VSCLESGYWWICMHAHFHEIAWTWSTRVAPLHPTCHSHIFLLISLLSCCLRHAILWNPTCYIGLQAGAAGETPWDALKWDWEGCARWKPIHFACNCLAWSMRSGILHPTCHSLIFLLLTFLPLAPCDLSATVEPNVLHIRSHVVTWYHHVFCPCPDTRPPLSC